MSSVRPLPVLIAVAFVLFAIVFAKVATSPIVTSPNLSPSAKALAAAPSSANPGVGYTYHGCSVYGPNDWFTTNLTTGGSSYVSNIVDPNSSNIISNFNSANGNPALILNGSTTAINAVRTPFNIVNANATLYVAQNLKYGFSDPYHNDPTKAIPWSNSFLSQGTCDGSRGGDCHSVVVDTNRCIDYETYQNALPASWNGSAFTAESLSVHDLKHPYDSQYKGSIGVTASGLNYLGIVDTGEDEQNYIARGQMIPHILEMELPSDKGLGGYVAPASAGNACSANCNYLLPFGARLRLRASYTCPSQASHPQAHFVCLQMQTYGIVVTDIGGAGYFGSSLEPTSSGSNPWDAGDISQLNGITLTDFDVMTLGQIYR